MSKVFHPIDHVIVPATTGEGYHPTDTKYKVSYGTEIWSGEPQKVFKVQMMYEDKVSGRRSPSYPKGTDDYERVHLAMKQLLNKYNK